MKIFSQVTATGEEWKPCIECGHVFVCGETISSLSSDTGDSVTCWYCCDCFDRHWSYSYARDDGEYICRRLDRIMEMEDFNNGNYRRYITHKIDSPLMNN